MGREGEGTERERREGKGGRRNGRDGTGKEGKEKGRKKATAPKLKFMAPPLFRLVLGLGSELGLYRPTYSMNIILIFCLFCSLLLTYCEWTIARTRFQSRQPGLDPRRHHTTQVPAARAAYKRTYRILPSFRYLNMCSLNGR